MPLDQVPNPSESELQALASLFGEKPSPAATEPRDERALARLSRAITVENGSTVEELMEQALRTEAGNMRSQRDRAVGVACFCAACACVAIWMFVHGGAR